MTRRPARPHRALRLAAVATLLLLGTALAGCKTSYRVEGRDAPVTVVLVAPAAATTAQTFPLLVYVGDRKAVDGTVTFPAGTTRITAPSIVVRAGEPTVSVILGGRTVATSAIRVVHTTWVVVTLTGQAATIGSSDRDPTAAR